MKLNEKIRVTKKYLISSTAAFILVVGIFLPYSAQAAAGDAYFSLSPSSGSYTVGNNLILSVSETSTSGDNTNAVQINLSYPSSLLQYQSSSLDGPFTLCGQQTGAGGVVNIGCASTTVVNSTSPVAQITFSVLGSGTASVAMTSGSDIDNTSGASVWNGVLPSSNFTLSKAAVTTPTTPTTSPTHTTTPATTSKSSSPSTPKSTATAPTTTPTTTTTTPTATAAPSLASLSVTVVDSKGKPIDGVKVTLDKQHIVLTNIKGIANFSGVVSGSYTLIASKTGQKSVQTKLVLTPGENKLLNLKLANNTSSSNYAVLFIIGIIVVIGLVATGIYFTRRRKLNVASPTITTSDSTITPNLSNVTTFPNPNIISPQKPSEPAPVVPSPSINQTPNNSLFPSSAPPTIITPQTPVSTQVTNPTETTISPVDSTQL